MAKVYSPMKWTGIKRKQAPEICALFPRTIHKYYELFLGGAGVLMYLLNECQDRLADDIEIVCSDTNEELIGIWNTIKNNPQQIINRYKELYALYNTTPDGILHEETLKLSIKERKENPIALFRKDMYYKIRDDYNHRHVDLGESDPCTFYWLMKAGFNGQIRYNKKGYFNTASMNTRPCAHPDLVEEMINNSSMLFNKYNVRFECKSYDEFRPEKDSVVYLDPPYFFMGEAYDTENKMDYEAFMKWVNTIDADWVYCSFDGSGAADWIFQHNKWVKMHLNNGKAGFKMMSSINKNEDKMDDTYECLYTKK